MRVIPVDASAATLLVTKLPEVKVKGRQTGEIAVDPVTNDRLMVLELLFIAAGGSDMIEDQGWDRLAADEKWEEDGLVFSSAVGKPLDAANVRRAFRQALKDVDGIDADEWTPRELRHSFVSLLSDRGVPLAVISRLVGHSGTAVTEEVYRKQIRPVIQTGAVAMDGIFGTDPRRP